MGTEVTVRSEGRAVRTPSCTGAAGAKDEIRKETVSALKRSKLNVKKGVCYCHTMVTMQNNVVRVRDGRNGTKNEKERREERGCAVRWKH